LEKARVERHLAAILAADVAGYSRLMGADEEGTLAQLKAHRGKLWNPAIKRHRGHIANTAGDSIVAEFASVLDAVACAVAIQRGMLERNSDVPADKRIEFRIGINLGEVIKDGTDIFGDGVNVAARLEGIADRGGIGISRQVLDQVESKLEVTFRELGRQNLKNIAKPVEVYAIHLDGGGSPGSRFLAAANLKQEIRYCKAADGVRLAYATVGDGPPILRSAHWLGHLEYDWEMPIAQHFLLGLARIAPWSDTTRAATACRIGMLTSSHWTSGSATWRRSPTPLGYAAFRSSVSRRAARSRSPMRSVIPSGSRI
jgi:class 3 adenylate cyclase